MHLLCIDVRCDFQLIGGVEERGYGRDVGKLTLWNVFMLLLSELCC